MEITGSFTFQPANITIKVGDTVEWKVIGIGHTSTSGAPDNQTGIWNSGFMRVGDSFRFTFTKEGTFPYFCDIHKSMRGTVTVGSGGPGGSGPSSPVAAATPDFGSDAIVY